MTSQGYRRHRFHVAAAEASDRLYDGQRKEQHRMLLLRPPETVAGRCCRSSSRGLAVPKETAVPEAPKCAAAAAAVKAPGCTDRSSAAAAVVAQAGWVYPGPGPAQMEDGPVLTAGGAAGFAAATKSLEAPRFADAGAVEAAAIFGPEGHGAAVSENAVDFRPAAAAAADAAAAVAVAVRHSTAVVVDEASTNTAAAAAGFDDVAVAAAVAAAMVVSCVPPALLAAAYFAGAAAAAAAACPCG